MSPDTVTGNLGILIRLVLKQTANFINVIKTTDYSVNISEL